MTDEEIRGPWGTIRVETVLVDGPLDGVFKTKYIGWVHYYLNGEPISEEEAQRIVESLPSEGEQP